MTQSDKDYLIEQLRSIAIQAHEAIDALRKDNFGTLEELLSRYQR